MVLGLIANSVIGALYFHPRPFMIGLGHQYLAHRPDGSFPSDHATFLWCLGFALVALDAFRAWAVVVLAMGLAVAWARVYLGVHFPFDMGGSLIVSLALSFLAPAIERRIRVTLLPASVTAYECVLGVAHLPPALFPREPRLPSPRAFRRP